MGSVLSFLGLPSPTALGIYLVVGIGLFGVGFYVAWHYKGLEEEAALAEAAQRVVVETAHMDAITEKASELATEQMQQIQVITLTQIQEVPQYVTVQADAHCIVPLGFVWLHNSAASGLPPVPPASGQSDDTPSGVKLSTVTNTVVKNYGSCRQEEQSLSDLQNWIKSELTVK